MKKINRKKTILMACVTILLAVAAVLLSKAVNAAKCRGYRSTSY